MDSYGFVGSATGHPLWQRMELWQQVGAVTAHGAADAFTHCSEPHIVGKKTVSLQVRMCLMGSVLGQVMLW